MTTIDKKYFRQQDAANYLAISRSCLWLYASQKKLNPIKLSQRVTVFTKDDLDRFVSMAVQK